MSSGSTKARTHTSQPNFFAFTVVSGVGAKKDSTIGDMYRFFFFR